MTHPESMPASSSTFPPAHTMFDAATVMVSGTLAGTTLQLSDFVLPACHAVVSRSP